MASELTPPLVIDGARVIAYAIIDEEVRWTGRQNLFVDDKKLGPVQRLAICERVFDRTDPILMFHCDENWTILGVTSEESIQRNIDDAERWYEGLREKWQFLDTSQSDAEAIIRSEEANASCSFCGRNRFEVQPIFSSNESNDSSSARVCAICIAGMSRALNEIPTDASAA
jgi:hypothetical protein